MVLVHSYESRIFVQWDHSAYVLVPWYDHMDPNHIYSIMGTFYGFCNGVFEGFGGRNVSFLSEFSQQTSLCLDIIQS